MPKRGRVERLASAWRSAAGNCAAAAGHTVRAAPGLAGLGLLSYGAWLAWEPAGFMAAGVLVLADVVADRIGSGQRGGEGS